MGQEDCIILGPSFLSFNEAVFSFASRFHFRSVKPNSINRQFLEQYAMGGNFLLLYNPPIGINLLFHYRATIFMATTSIVYKFAELYITPHHRLNMELDLQSVFGLHVHSCSH